MLDIKFIEENPDIVRDAVKNKNVDGVDVDELLKRASKRKELRQKIDELNRKKNEAAEARDVEEGKKVKQELQKLSAEFDDVEKEYVALLLKVPNIPSPDTPVGKDEDENKVLQQIGDKPSFSFKPKPHWEIGKDLGIIDSEKASEVSGARFNYLKGDAAMLQYALFDFALKMLTDVDTLKDIAEKADAKVTVTPFIPVVPPVLMRPSVMNRMARLDPEEMYLFEKDDLVLVGSAEHTLGSIHLEEILNEKDLPLRYFAFTPAFRREAGSYGKDTRGIIRQHQFDKIEMETFVKPEDGYPEQEFLVAIQQRLLQLLELPYQVVSICTGDMGKPDHRQFDMETWMPGQDSYKETHTSDYIGGYQARRLKTRVKRENGNIEHVHMNDATLIAMGRLIAAILENNQQEDGSVKVPRVLQSYIGKDIIKGRSANTFS